jgi:hypothetical protein
MAGLPVSPVNAWNYTSRHNTHDSGPKRIAISISYRTFIDYLLPVCPGASRTTINSLPTGSAGPRGGGPTNVNCRSQSVVQMRCLNLTIRGTSAPPRIGLKGRLNTPTRRCRINPVYLGDCAYRLPLGISAGRCRRLSVGAAPQARTNHSSNTERKSRRPSSSAMIRTASGSIR